jgi:signal transduction histidine kinase
MKREFNGLIMSEGKRLAKIINDVLDASRVEDGKIAINKPYWIYQIYYKKS